MSCLQSIAPRLSAEQEALLQPPSALLPALTGLTFESL